MSDAIVFLAREGSSLGGFPPDEVREGLRTGRFLPTDLFYVEGMPEWRPLREWDAAPASDGRRPSTARLLAIVGGLLAAGLTTLVLAVLAFSVLRPARPAEPFPRTLTLFRTGMLHDWHGTLHRYASEPVQRQFAEWSVRAWHPVTPDVGWSYWFNTAVLTGVSLGSARPRTAFYHPWSDTFWLAEWDLAEKPRITRSWFGPGDVLRSGGRPPWNPTPLWLRGRGPRADVLASALAESVPAAERALSRRSWPDEATRNEPERTVSATLCRVALLELLRGLEPLRGPVEGEQLGVRQLREALRDLLRRRPDDLRTQLRDAPENPPATRRALAAIPRDAVSALQPVCRLGAGRTAMVVLMPSQTADLALATVWDLAPSRARLLRVDVLPFAELLDAARSRTPSRS
jgi:hypothetical protein